MSVKPYLLFITAARHKLQSAKACLPIYNESSSINSQLINLISHGPSS
jgi:hypothetical protein